MCLFFLGNGLRRQTVLYSLQNHRNRVFLSVRNIEIPTNKNEKKRKYSNILA